MGSTHSIPGRASWPPNASRRKHLWALLRVHGHSTPVCDLEVSQASEVICDILEHIFALLVEGGDDRTWQLLVVSRVNRHWNKVAERLLYRTIMVSSARQLVLLDRTLGASVPLRSRVLNLRVPRPLKMDPLRTHNQAGIKLSNDQMQRERERAIVACTNTLLHLLSTLTHIISLQLNGKAIPLVHDAVETPARPRPLTNLSTLKSLHLIGLHDDRWLFLMRYAPNIKTLRCDPSWHAYDDPQLPFQSYSLESLALGNGLRLTPSQLQLMLSLPSSPSPSPASRIHTLELTDTPYILSSPDLGPTLAFLSQTLQRLTITSSNPSTITHITSSLTSILPSFTKLTHIMTNAYKLRTFPPSLTHFTLSLAETKYAGSVEPRPIGTIYNTINSILDAVARSTTSLKVLNVEDATMEDYLHFHLVGTNEYGNDEETGKQNRLWMKAGQMGVLVQVAKFANPPTPI